MKKTAVLESGGKGGHIIPIYSITKNKTYLGLANQRQYLGGGGVGQGGGGGGAVLGGTTVSMTWRILLSLAQCLHKLF